MKTLSFLNLLKKEFNMTFNAGGWETSKNSHCVPTKTSLSYINYQSFLFYSDKVFFKENMDFSLSFNTHFLKLPHLFENIPVVDFFIFKHPDEQNKKKLFAVFSDYFSVKKEYHIHDKIFHTQNDLADYFKQKNLNPDRDYSQVAVFSHKFTYFVDIFGKQIYRKLHIPGQVGEGVPNLSHLEQTAEMVKLETLTGQQVGNLIEKFFQLSEEMDCFINTLEKDVIQEDNKIPFYIIGKDDLFIQNYFVDKTIILSDCDEEDNSFNKNYLDRLKETEKETDLNLNTEQHFNDEVVFLLLDNEMPFEISNNLNHHRDRFFFDFEKANSFLKEKIKTSIKVKVEEIEKIKKLYSNLKNLENQVEELEVLLENISSH